MNKKNNLIASFIGAGATLFTLGTTSAQAFSITPTNDGNTLANTILGSGITISNVTYTGANGASGTFTGGLSSGIGIDAGIIMTSGQASSAVGPNDSDGTTTANGFAGDADLAALIPGFSTFDATILEFDFETAGGDLFFNYVFASEEYNEYVNSAYNDVFGFFLDGVNIALIPGTTTPVSIDNVNGGNPLGTSASNPAFYINNDLQDGGPFYDIEYDGFTTKFTAQALGLTPGKHKIKLAIADAGDNVLDSAVFIQAGSFSDTDPDTQKTPEPASLLGLLTIGAFGTKSFIKRRKL